MKPDDMTGTPARFEVQRTGAVDWSFESAGAGDGRLWLLALLPAILISNALVCLSWSIFRRGWTLHTFDEQGRRLSRSRFRTKQQAEEARDGLML